MSRPYRVRATRPSPRDSATGGTGHQVPTKRRVERVRSPAEAGLLMGMSPYPKGASPIEGLTHPSMSVTPEIPHEDAGSRNRAASDIRWT
jgi:hypothetical protein